MCLFLSRNDSWQNDVFGIFKFRYHATFYSIPQRANQKSENLYRHNQIYFAFLYPKFQNFCHQNSNLTFTHQNCSNQSCTSSWTIRGQHQIEFVINSHQLANSWFHDIGKMRMVPKNWTINCNHHIFVVHFFQKCSNSSTDHKSSPSWNTFTNVSAKNYVKIDFTLLNVWKSQKITLTEKIFRQTI